MKKTYMNPSMNVLAVDEKDVIATSLLSERSGYGGVYSIDDIKNL